MRERDPKLESIRVRVSKKLKAAVQQLAHKNDVSEAYILREAVRQFLRKYRGKRRKIERGLIVAATTAALFVFVHIATHQHHHILRTLPFVIILLWHFVLHCFTSSRMGNAQPQLALESFCLRRVG